MFKGIWKGKEVAVKVFDPLNSKVMPMGVTNIWDLGFDEQETRRELALTSLLEHENIISCLGGSLHSEKMFIVLEFMQLGSLKDYVENAKVGGVLGGENFGQRKSNFFFETKWFLSM